MSKKNIKAEANEFDEAIEASKSFVEKNIKPLGYGIGAVLVVVIGIQQQEGRRGSLRCPAAVYGR